MIGLNYFTNLFSIREICIGQNVIKIKKYSQGKSKFVVDCHGMTQIGFQIILIARRKHNIVNITVMSKLNLVQKVMVE